MAAARNCFKLLVQRTHWLPSLDDVSWKHLQSSFEINVDKLLRCMKQLVSSSSCHCKLFPSSFQDLLYNTSLVRILLSILLEKVESSSCDHDHVRFSAVILAIVEASIQNIFESQVKVKSLSRHVSFCVHIVITPPKGSTTRLCDLSHAKLVPTSLRTGRTARRRAAAAVFVHRRARHCIRGRAQGGVDVGRWQRAARKEKG